MTECALHRMILLLTKMNNMTCAPNDDFSKMTLFEVCKMDLFESNLRALLCFLSSVKLTEPKVRFHGCDEETNFV